MKCSNILEGEFKNNIGRGLGWICEDEKLSTGLDGFGHTR
jgi:hypothetical protein